MSASSCYSGVGRFAKLLNKKASNLGGLDVDAETDVVVCLNVENKGGISRRSHPPQGSLEVTVE